MNSWKARLGSQQLQKIENQVRSSVARGSPVDGPLALIDRRGIAKAVLLAGRDSIIKLHIFFIRTF